VKVPRPARIVVVAVTTDVKPAEGRLVRHSFLQSYCVIGCDNCGHLSVKIVNIGTGPFPSRLVPFEIGTGPFSNSGDDLVWSHKFRIASLVESRRTAHPELPSQHLVALETSISRDAHDPNRLSAELKYPVGSAVLTIPKSRVGNAIHLGLAL